MNLTFYKLESQYSGDTTKNCKLTMTELDSNFYGLKNETISGGTFDKDTNILKLVKYNGEEICIDITSSKQSEKVEITTSGDTKTEATGVTDPSTDTEIIITPEPLTSGDTSESGSTTVIVESIERIYHDNSLIGEGSDTNPVKVNPATKTGVYKQCLDIVDNLPSEKNVGDRYLYKQTENNLGYLYNKEALNVISEALEAEDSLWRIPTKEDWDKLLNFCEESDEDRNHDSNEDGNHGRIAAYKLERKEGWNDADDTYGFCIVPCSPLPLKETLKVAGFWTNTDGKVKEFVDKRLDVLQLTIDDDKSYYSIRLVADALGGNVILGKEYSYVYIPEINQYWIGENLAYNADNVNAVEPEDEYATIGDACSVVEWDGNTWNMNRLSDGDEVYVGNKNEVVKYQWHGNELIKMSKTEYYENGDSKTFVDAGMY